MQAKYILYSKDMVATKIIEQSDNTLEEIRCAQLPVSCTLNAGVSHRWVRIEFADRENTAIYT